MTTYSLQYSDASNSTALTMTLASLASDTSLLAGRASSAFDNSSGLYLKAFIHGQLTLGSSPTANRLIRGYLFHETKVASGTPTFPPAGSTSPTTSDEALTFTSYQLASSGIKRAFNFFTSSTTGEKVSFAVPVHVIFGYVPRYTKLFITHSTGVALDSTSSNHWAHWTGLKGQS